MHRMSRKRRYSKSRSRASKRTKFAASGSGRPPRNLSLKAGNANVVSISRGVQFTGVSLPAATDVFGGYYFALSDVPGSAQFTSLYDQYRFIAVKLEFIPTALPTTYWNGAAVVNPACPILHTCVDLDDANTPTANQLMEHETYKCHGAFTPATTGKYVRWVEPALAIESYQTGGFGGYSSKTKQWCDSASPSVQHYGIKYWVEMPAGSPATNLYIQATYYLEFKLPI